MMSILNKTIYIVMYAYYSDWEIKGYFSNKEEAEQYCIAHSKEDLFIEKVNCFDGSEPQNKSIKCYYRHEVVFDKKYGSSFIMRDEPERYSFYDSKEGLEKDEIKDFNLKRFNWISFIINLKKNDRKLAEKIAQDKLAQYLAEKEGI